jgi:hypothetical protein
MVTVTSAYDELLVHPKDHNAEGRGLLEVPVVDGRFLPHGAGQVHLPACSGRRTVQSPRTCRSRAPGRQDHRRVQQDGVGSNFHDPPVEWLPYSLIPPGMKCRAAGPPSMWGGHKLVLRKHHGSSGRRMPRYPVTGSGLGKLVVKAYREARYRCRANSTGRPAWSYAMRSMVSRALPRVSSSVRASAAEAFFAPMR